MFLILLVIKHETTMCHYFFIITIDNYALFEPSLQFLSAIQCVNSL